MRRRELMILLGGAMTAPRALRAQQRAMPVIGSLYNNYAGPGPAVAGFRQGLSETGYIDGQNVAIEYRFSEGRNDRLPGLAADLVARKVDVILAAGDPAVLAAKKPPRRSQSSSASPATRSSRVWSSVSPDRAET